MGVPEAVLDCVRRAIGRLPRRLQTPVITDTDRANVARYDPLKTDAVEAFEEDLKAHLYEVRGKQDDPNPKAHVIAVATGTAALHLALVCSGVAAGDEVLVPSLTFAATVHAIMHTGATPHFVDIRESDLGINPFKLKQYLGDKGFFDRSRGVVNNIPTGRPITAMLPVHLLGIPCEAVGLSEIARTNTMMMIEDAAESLGARTWRGDHCGTIGKAGAFSFNLNKMVTTGGGGAVVTTDADVADRVRHRMQQSKVDHPYLWNHDRVGWNYRMPNLCAALGLGQLRRLHKTLERKREIAERYRLCFAECKVAKMVTGTGNDWLNAIALDPRYMDKRDEVIKLLIENGYESRALFTPLHQHNYLKQFPRQSNLDASDYMFRRVICLPSSIEPAI